MSTLGGSRERGKVVRAAFRRVQTSDKINESGDDETKPQTRLAFSFSLRHPRRAVCCRGGRGGHYSIETRSLSVKACASCTTRNADAFELSRAFVTLCKTWTKERRCCSSEKMSNVCGDYLRYYTRRSSPVCVRSASLNVGRRRVKRLWFHLSQSGRVCCWDGGY